MMVSGHNEVTMLSQAPKGVRTASGFAQATQQDDSRIALQERAINQALSKAGRFLLRVVANEYEEERLLRIVGDKNEVELRAFTGHDLLGDDDRPGIDYYDVSIQVDTGHRSRQSQQEFLLQAANVGLIHLDNEQERQFALKAFDVGLPEDEMFGPLKRAESQAHIENRVMAQYEDDEFMEKGAQLGPNSWDDTGAHIEVITNFMRHPDFLKLKLEHPDRVQRFVNHLNAHQQVQAQEAQEQAALAAMQQPGGGGPQPGASAPAPNGPMSLPGAPQAPKQPQSPHLDPRTKSLMS